MFMKYYEYFFLISWFLNCIRTKKRFEMKLRIRIHLYFYIWHIFYFCFNLKKLKNRINLFQIILNYVDLW